jgi:sortase (surface protein transpeptidase)
MRIGHRSVAAAILAGVGLTLVAIAAFGLIARHDHPSDAVVRSPRPVERPVAENTTSPTRPTRPATPPTTAKHRNAAKAGTASKRAKPTARRPIPLPVEVSIAAVGIDSRLIPLGLNADRTLQVPTDFSVAGWYTGRPVPGELGPSIIAGHLDSKVGPAAFYHLRNVKPGMKVDVARSDGTVAQFEVTTMEQDDKDEFPTARVYGPTKGAQLRLITCGGTFDSSIGHYEDNLIVFAKLDRIT